MENIVQGQWLRGPSADLGDEISQSVRFRGPQRMTGPDQMPTGNFTVSFWYKRALGPNSTQTFLMFGPNQAYQLYPTSGHNQLHSRRGADVGTALTGGLDDHGAWYHIVLVNTSGTTTCYVNGVLQSGTETTPSGSSVMTIGSNSNSSQDDRLSGYLAEYNLLDGQTLAATDFGRFNEDNVWVPKELSFTSAQYGDRGFRLTFDSTQSSGIGTDSAPTGTGHAAANNWTGTDFDTTAISSSNFDNDVDYFDTPTSNYATSNPINSINQEAEEANLRTRASGGTSDPDPAGLTVYKIPSDGDFYFECMTDYGVDNNYGSWATGFFVDTEDHNYSTFASSQIYTGGIGFTVDLSSNNWNNNANLGSSGQQDITTDSSTWASAICGVRIKNNQITITRNGSATNVTDTTFSKLASTGDGFYRIFTYNYYGSSDTNAWTRYNFGQRPYVHAPSGVTPQANGIQTNNLAEPTIKKGNKHFGILTYSAPASPSYPITINGSGGNNGTGELDFGGQPDLVWIKMTNGTENHILFDSQRGAGKSLRSDENIAEVNRTNFAFATNGFTISAADAETYQQNDSYAAFCWKGGGTAVSNTDGSETSSVSANTTAGFSIVKWTPDDAAGTVGHGLSQAPEMILLKGLDSSSWYVYHHSDGATHTKYASLSTDVEFSASSAVWNDTAPTSTVFSVGTVGNAGRGGADAVAYCWHGVEGYSKFGTYYGNGDADGAFIHTGFKPRFVMIKGRSNAGNWNMYNASTDPSNPIDVMLRSNLTNQSEAASGQNIDFLSNGFKCRGLNANINETYHYIYMAFAEHPFGGTNQPPVTAR